MKTVTACPKTRDGLDIQASTFVMIIVTSLFYHRRGDRLSSKSFIFPL